MSQDESSGEPVTISDPTAESEVGMVQTSHEIVEVPAPSKLRQSEKPEDNEDTKFEIGTDPKSDTNSDSNPESESEGLRKRTSSAVKIKPKLYSVADVENGNV